MTANEILQSRKSNKNKAIITTERKKQIAQFQSQTEKRRDEIDKLFKFNIDELGCCQASDIIEEERGKPIGPTAQSEAALGEDSF